MTVGKDKADKKEGVLVPTNTKAESKCYKYDPDITPGLIEDYAAENSTVTHVCYRLGISRNTWYEWLKKFPEIEQAFNNGRDRTIKVIVDALVMKATGFVKTEEINTKFGIEQIEKYYPPDQKAIEYFLNNRIPQDWKNKRTIEHEGNVRMDHVHTIDEDDEARLARQMNSLLSEGSEKPVIEVEAEADAEETRTD